MIYDVPADVRAHARSLQMRIANANRAKLTSHARLAYLEGVVSLSKAEAFVEAGNNGSGYIVREPSVFIPPKPPKKKKVETKESAEE